MGLFKKNDKQTAVAFVDYEHWFYSYTNRMLMNGITRYAVSTSLRIYIFTGISTTEL